MHKERRVGVFVVAAIVVLSTLVFLIGENANLWSKQVTYRTSFGDVAGLKPGSPVRLGGVDVGSVTEVGHMKDPTDTRIYVELDVVDREAKRIREATVARIANKGLLGDKMVELSVPTEPSPALRPDTPIRSEDPADVGKYVARAEELVSRIEATLGNLEQGTRFLADPNFSNDAKSLVASLAKVARGVADEPSAAHALLVDPKSGQLVAGMLDDLKATTGELRNTSAAVRSVADAVRTGGGLLHTVLYDDELGTSAKRTVQDASSALRAVREGNGIAHEVLYGGEPTSKLLGNVVGIAEDLRRIVADVRTGKGTMGALLVDPSLYDDLKGLVGNVERSAVLRALVRFAISADDRRKLPEGPRGADKKDP